MLATVASRSYDLDNVGEFYDFKAFIFNQVKVTWMLLNNWVRETDDGLLWLGMSSGEVNVSYYLDVSPIKLTLTTYYRRVRYKHSPMPSNYQDIGYHPDFLGELLALLIQLPVRE